MDGLKKAEKDSEISKDEHRDQGEDVQKLTDSFIGKIDNAFRHKEREIMQVSRRSLKPEPRGPNHVAVIMDGNGRWAKARGLPRTEGHRRSAKAVRAAVAGAARLGIPYLTLFGFSSENWKRPKSEVGDLMGLLRLYLKSEICELDKRGVRFRVIGDRSALKPDIQDLILDAERQTAENVALTLTLALNYGGRMEIVDAVRTLAEAARRGELKPDDITEDLFDDHLYMADIPDPDLTVPAANSRSAISCFGNTLHGFLFLDIFWPDFVNGPWPGRRSFSGTRPPIWRRRRLVAVLSDEADKPADWRLEPRFAARREKDFSRLGVRMISAFVIAHVVIAATYFGEPYFFLMIAGARRSGDGMGRARRRVHGGLDSGDRLRFGGFLAYAAGRDIPSLSLSSSRRCFPSAAPMKASAAGWRPALFALGCLVPCSFG